MDPALTQIPEKRIAGILFPYSGFPVYLLTITSVPGFTLENIVLAIL
jgi:hypothetical protein